MDGARLKRQFIREAKSSPKKAAVLALVMMVAAWKIIPLLTSMFSGQQEAAPIAAQTPAAAMPASSPLTVNPPSAGLPSWRELAKNIKSDPLMKSAELVGSRNPFGDLPEPQLANAQVERAEPEPTLSAAGLVLSSTAVGSSRRTALINGRIYAEGDVLNLPGAQIQVVNIRPRSAVVESNGERLELTIAERPASEKIQVREQSFARTRAMSEG